MSWSVWWYVERIARSRSWRTRPLHVAFLLKTHIHRAGVRHAAGEWLPFGGQLRLWHVRLIWRSETRRRLRRKPMEPLQWIRLHSRLNWIMNNRDERRENFFSFASDFLRFVVIIIHFSFRHPRSEKSNRFQLSVKKVVVAVKRRMSGRKLCAIDKSSLFNHAAAALGRRRKPRIHPEWYVEMLKKDTNTNVWCE